MNNAIFLSFVLNTNSDITGIIITKSFRQSRLLFDETRAIIENHNKNNLKIVRKRADIFELELNNGSRLISLPLNRDSICGLRADFIITDVKMDSKEMLNIIYPMILSPIAFHKNPRFIYSLDSEELLII